MRSKVNMDFIIPERKLVLLHSSKNLLWLNIQPSNLHLFRPIMWRFSDTFHVVESLKGDELRPLQQQTEAGGFGKMFAVVFRDCDLTGTTTRWHCGEKKNEI